MTVHLTTMTVWMSVMALICLPPITRIMMVMVWVMIFQLSIVLEMSLMAGRVTVAMKMITVTLIIMIVLECVMVMLFFRPIGMTLMVMV